MLEIDEAQGELRVRFVGSCANCPYSLLSMERIVKPTLLAIPGIESVVHRARAKQAELSIPFPIEAACSADVTHERSSDRSSLSAHDVCVPDALGGGIDTLTKYPRIPIVAR